MSKIRFCHDSCHGSVGYMFVYYVSVNLSLVCGPVGTHVKVYLASLKRGAKAMI